MNKEPMLTITLTEEQFNDVRRALNAQVTHWLLLSTDNTFENQQGAETICRDLTNIRDHFDKHYRKSMMLRGIK